MSGCDVKCQTACEATCQVGQEVVPTEDLQAKEVVPVRVSATNPNLEEVLANKAQVENPKVLEMRLLVRDCLREYDPKVVIVTIRRAFDDRIAEMKKDLKPGQDDGKIRGMEWWRGLLDS